MKSDTILDLEGKVSPVVNEHAVALSEIDDNGWDWLMVDGGTLHQNALKLSFEGVLSHLNLEGEAHRRRRRRI